MRNITILQLLLLCLLVRANVEKLIFLGPQRGPEVEELASLGYLDRLPRLSTSVTSVKHQALARFPPTTASSETWILLEGLKRGQRYEVRVCWSASQPTAFDIFVHEPHKLFQTPSLNNSLYEYSQTQIPASRIAAERLDTGSPVRHNTPIPVSALFLHISATADYFSTDSTLMQNGLPVEVEIILDPYLLNIFPKSLGQTAVYLVAIAVLSWLLSSAVWRWLSSISQSDELYPGKDKVKLLSRKTN